MTDEIDQKRNNNKAFPNIFITHMPAGGAEAAAYYCMNCKRFYKGTEGAAALRVHMVTIHGFATST